VFEVLRRSVEQLRRLVDEIEPDRCDGAGARALVELFSEVERLGAAGKALATRQVVATGAWKEGGAHRDAASWLSGTTGTTVGAARATIETAERLRELPATEAALRSGALSAVQVDAIADAASADPAAEAELLERAGYDGVRGLRNECARVKAAACVDADERYERVREARSFRHWADPDGTGRIDIRGPVDLTTRVAQRVASYEKELFDRARKEGRKVRSDALAFDALVAWAASEPGSGGGPPQTTTVVRVDWSALVRGHTEPGELCEVVGGGPIPVSVAQCLLEDSFVKAVLVGGTDVLAVSHLGRMIPAHLRTAVEELHPECDIEGCNVTLGLQIDHNLPVEEQGPTAMWNLGRLCPHDHVHKHRYGLRLVGEPGRMRFVPASEWEPPVSARTQPAPRAPAARPARRGSGRQPP
jgi:hypothetical protein